MNTGDTLFSIHWKLSTIDVKSGRLHSLYIVYRAFGLFPTIVCIDLHTYIRTYICARGAPGFVKHKTCLALSLATALADVRTLTDQPRIVTRRSLLHLHDTCLK